MYFGTQETKCLDQWTLLALSPGGWIPTLWNLFWPKRGPLTIKVASSLSNSREKRTTRKIATFLPSHPSLSARNCSLNCEIWVWRKPSDCDVNHLRAGNQLWKKRGSTSLILGKLRTSSLGRWLQFLGLSMRTGKYLPSMTAVVISAVVTAVVVVATDKNTVSFFQGLLFIDHRFQYFILIISSLLIFSGVLCFNMFLRPTCSTVSRQEFQFPFKSFILIFFWIMIS